ncbi:MAG: hypothetical protein QOJ68_559 [Blastococcus sp.]|jgi:hypothetical protein|nr:hypothetical protein [Blastococcus sp.]
MTDQGSTPPPPDPQQPGGYGAPQPGQPGGYGAQPPGQPGGYGYGPPPGQPGGYGYGPPPVAGPPGYGGGPPPNYLVWAILSTVLCCWPLGIVSIVFAAQVNNKYAAGDMAGAQEASRKAKLFAIVSAVSGVVVVVAAVVILIVAGSMSTTSTTTG